MSDDPEKMFVADMSGIFAQHAAMWSIYIETVKILVTSTSLPIIAASVIFSITKAPIDFANLPDVIFWTLVVMPILNLLLVGVLIQHRLVILFYARCLNGYRRVYLKEWNSQRRTEAIELPMPTNASYPHAYEFIGPMGLIVHCSGIVNGLFALGAAYAGHRALGNSVVFGCIVVAIYEVWYYLSATMQSRSVPRARTAVTPPAPSMLQSPPAEAKPLPQGDKTSDTGAAIGGDPGNTRTEP